MEIVRVEPTPSPNTMKIVLSEKEKITSLILIHQSQKGNLILSMMF